jgi:hypothetical protein
MHNALFWLKLPISKKNVEEGSSYILKLLEPREKRIAKLEEENKRIKDSDSLCQLIGEQKLKITELEQKLEQNKIDLAISEHDREHDDYELTEVYAKV